MVKSLQNAIYTTIDKIVQQRIKEAKYDTTYKGVVKSTASSVCDVQIDGDVFKCKKLEGDDYESGDVVYVLVPQSNSVDKIILGRVT